MRPSTVCRFAALTLLAASSASAAEVVPMGIPDLVGPRSLALSAGIGIANANDGLFLNPASVAARRRYSIDALLLVDRRGADTTGEWFGSSVVDSMSAPVTGLVSYLRSQKGAYQGNLWHLGLAGPIVEKLYLGLTGKYYSVKGPRNTSAASADAGLFWQPADYVSIGAAGYNLVSISNPAVAPRGWGAGLAVGSDESVQVTADWRADVDRNTTKTLNRYGVGAEALLGRMFPIRAGWQRDEVLATDWWSIGAGLVSRSGVALDLGYRQGMKDPSARTIAASLRLYFFN